MRERTPLPGELLRALPNLELVVFTGLRTRSIDMAACNVVVCHIRPGETQAATAELTWTLILAVMRHLPAEMAGMREGGWRRTLGTTVAGRSEEDGRDEGRC